MTSASELFYNRRSRFGRTSPDLGLDSPPPPPERSFHHNSTHSRRTHRHDLDGCDPLRRYPHPHARHSQPRASHQERAAFRLEESTSQFGSGNGIETENLTSPSGPALTANERLPGAVLLARARLRERLRGLPLSGSRPRSRVMSNINNGGIGAGGESRPFDAGEWDNVSLTDWLTNGFPSTDLSSQSVQLQSLGGHNKKPSGLTQEAIDCLQMEHFSSKEAVPRAARDCSICLESFFHGDRLICLPCEHRFHAVCLGPWVRIHGDCPYCRSVIVVEKRITETS